MNDFVYLPSADPAPYSVDLDNGPLYHGDCGHSHWLDDACPDADASCGSFLCCVN